MKQSTKKITLAASAFAFAALFSFSWSEQSGIALSIESAEARVGRPLTPVSVAGVARRQYRRAAIGTAAAVGAGAAYYGGAGYYAGSPYYSDTVRGARAAYVGGYAASVPDKHPPALRSERLLCRWPLVRLQRVGRLRSPQRNQLHARHHGQAR